MGCGIQKDNIDWIEPGRLRIIAQWNHYRRLLEVLIISKINLKLNNYDIPDVSVNQGTSAITT